MKTVKPREKVKEKYHKHIYPSPGLTSCYYFAIFAFSYTLSTYYLYYYCQLFKSEVLT